MDDADRAQLLEERERETILEARRSAGPSNEQQLRRGYVVICRDCWRDIDDERLRVSPEAVRCLLCQNLHEKRQPRQA